MTTKELAALIGRRGAYSNKTQPGIAYGVEITDARERFGRIDVEIVPVTGTGSLWVSLDNVRLEDVPSCA